MITSISEYPARKWLNEDQALGELREEGWTISGHTLMNRQRYFMDMR